MTHKIGDVQPFVSVIMPVRHEEAFIQRSLGSVLAQNYPLMEVIIADGMSEDNTRTLVQMLSATSHDIPVSLIDNPGKTRPCALNLGIRQARGEIITFVDGHCEIAPDYISQCVKHLQAHEEAAVVGGPIKTIGTGFVGEAIALALSTPFGVGGAAFRTVQDRIMFVDTVAFGAYRREVLDRAGPFREELSVTEDDEYNYRLRAMGYKILMSPHICSHYYSRSSLVKLWKQYFRYGLYKVLVFRAHPGQMRLRQFVPPLFVLALLLGGLLALLSPWLLRLWLLLIGVYLAVNLAASGYSGRRGGWKYVVILPLIYTILHLAYGLGFLLGLIRFGRFTDRFR